METILNLPIVSIFIIAITVIVSYKAFKDETLMQEYQLSTEGVLIQKKYFKLLYSALIHADWGHLLFNMIAFYSFATKFENSHGAIVLLIIYIGSILAGSVFALYNNNCNSHYIASGASAGVCGIVFASIVSSSTAKIGFILIPIFIPGWIFGTIFILASYYAIPKKTEIAHDAHLAGSLAGTLLAFMVLPKATFVNPWNIIIVVSFTWVIIKYVQTNRALIKYDINKIQNKVKEEKERKITKRIQTDLDTLLSKISQKGIEALSKEELRSLDNLSKQI